MILSTPWSKNQLLAALPDTEWPYWHPLLEAVDLPAGKLLYESGKCMSHVFFPLTALVSLYHVTESGATAEVALVGQEGVVGVSSFMGGGGSTSHAVVLCAGQALRMPSAAIRHQFEQSSQVQNLMLRYTQALLTQMAHTAVCNRHHSVEQALSRWLLLSLDRVEGHELLMTQEIIANMLGVRREGVTEAALKLQRAGLIRYSRGRITVLDQQGLEDGSCECYRAIKSEYERLLPARAVAQSAPAGIPRFQPVAGRLSENAPG
ncbi:Crp/Fnr family transcriptional regulator [Malikia sp.]|uniref:Crp/Fnr family transcriptional regulator n=1 Tax=Malikia sp. TaxID=2070706 RepID=UPI00261C5B12|nr:Crp/Fnr family transcriptional regulator [Malikia sp.]MDD2729283.1 Crp/Fnr family transcriptional regulator [Malikia sp.]